MRTILKTLLMLALLPVVSLPDNANAQSAKTAFQDGYADVNGVRLHYASIGTGPLVLFLHYANAVG